PGFSSPVHRWCEGVSLEELLEETEMAPGDFVRNCKQLLDLLRKIEEVADPRAGEGRVAANVEAVRRALVREGIEHRVQIAQRPGEATRLASAALDEGSRYLAGGG